MHMRFVPLLLVLLFSGAAAAQGRKNTQRNRDRLAKRMTPDQIAAAQRMAREWMNKHQK